MMELFLDGGFLRFDGDVIELFGEKGENDRYHVRYVDKIELASGRKGITLMNLRYGKGGRGGGLSGWIVLQGQEAQAQKFIQVVKDAKTET
jgi:hypothetical protein